MATNWPSVKLLPESVPHLLHQDLAYLWVLDLPPAERPSIWRKRVEAWKRLLSLFLLGRLELRTTRLDRPLLDFTKRYGIEIITELLYSGRVVGVSSNVVLVRPLPNFEDEDLKLLLDVQPAAASQVDYCLNLLIDTVKGCAEQPGDRSIQKTLVAVLERVRDDWRGSGAPAAEVFGLREHRLPLLQAVSFEPAPEQVDRISVFTSTGIKRHPFVPKCSCGATLLDADPGPAVEVTSTVVTIPCAQGHPNRIPLDAFFIWLPDDSPGEAVCWTDREDDLPSASEPDRYQFPPPAELTGGGVRFTWPASLAADNRRTLRFTFPRRAVKAVSFTRDALYYRVLRPGRISPDFSGLPVRWRWRSAWRESDPVRAEASALHYERVRIEGIPFAINLDFGNLRLQHDEDLAVAVYPKRMHASWQPYRVAALGAGGSGYEVQFPNAVDLLGFVKESSGWPAQVSVETPDGETGVTWDLSQAAAPAGNGSAARVCLGLDFGTSNTVIYFKARGQGADLNSEQNAVPLRNLADMVHWLGQPGDPGWFLPPAPAGQDRYLFPSALWVSPGSKALFLRWSDRSPAPGASALHGFKWDQNLRDNSPYRAAYLRELLLFTLPVIFERLGGRGAAHGVDIGFAYPLAFDYPRRNAYARLLEDLRISLGRETGLDLNFYTINESLASVRAGGAFNPGEVFLVADMGGRTLDLSLFTYHPNFEQQSESLHYVGSLDFGGEIFLDAVTEKKVGAVEGAGYDSEYWHLRDAIVRGTAGRTDYYQDATLYSVLNRFQPMALEYIRSLLCAFRKHQPETPVNVLLAGNGWRLRELFAEGANPGEFCRQYFGSQFRLFGLPGVELLPGQVPGIHSSKHLVACGALKSAMINAANELAHSEFPSRLPMGRSMEVRTGIVEWHEPAGESGVEFPNEVAIQTGPINFQLDSEPVPPEDWREILIQALGREQPYPRTEALREQILGVLRNRHLGKGPLALVLEKHWRGLLCAREL